MKYQVPCPHCNFLNKLNIDAHNYRPEVVCCDSEEGGCDRLFVLTVSWPPPILSAYKIEGLK
jgi:hypothetical protein